MSMLFELPLSYVISFGTEICCVTSQFQAEVLRAQLCFAVILEAYTY